MQLFGHFYPQSQTLTPFHIFLSKHSVCARVLSHSDVSGSVAHQAPLSMGFSRQEYWSGLPFLPPGDLPDLGTELAPPMSPALAGGLNKNFFFFLPLSPLGSPSKHSDKW